MADPVPSALPKRIKRPTNHVRFIRLKNFPDRL